MKDEVGGWKACRLGVWWLLGLCVCSGGANPKTQTLNPKPWLLFPQTLNPKPNP